MNSEHITTNINRISEEPRLEQTEAPFCPECGHSEIDTRWEDRPFTYGSGTDAVEIPVRLPVRKCRKCSFAFFDEEAEDLRHEAVCRHLGRLTPEEIKALRAKYGFSRVDLARLTGLGEATIARWERGELIQNAGNDSLLWLLLYQENVDRLRMRANAEDPLAPPIPVFRTPKVQEAAVRGKAGDHFKSEWLERVA